MSTHNMHFQDKKKRSRIIPNILISAVMGIKNLRTHERVRNSHGKRAKTVEAIEFSVYHALNVVILGPGSQSFFSMTVLNLRS